MEEHGRYFKAAWKSLNADFSGLGGDTGCDVE